MNAKSSRSHYLPNSVVVHSPRCEGLFPGRHCFIKKARLNLCDLAGSEKVNKGEEMKSEHFRELKNINQSLTTFGKVIASLSNKECCVF
jgi:hypothetical protein